VQKTASGLITSNECNGELVTGEGAMHLRQTQTGSGTFINEFRGHFTAEGTHGNEYVGNIRFTNRSRSFDCDVSFHEVLVSRGQHLTGRCF
jgi:hypothetical protein